MTEREFLIKFSDWFLVTKLERKGREDNFFVDDFLEEHHKEYFEVEFVKKDIEEIRNIYNDAMRTGNYEKGKELPDPKPSEPEKPLEFKGVPIKFDDVVKEEMDKLKPTITDILNKKIK